MLLSGLIAAVAVALVVTGVDRMVRQGRESITLVHVLVVALVGAVVGFGLSIVGEDSWALWRGVVVETVVSVFGVVVAVGRGGRDRPRRR